MSVALPQMVFDSEVTEIVKPEGCNVEQDCYRLRSCRKRSEYQQFGVGRT
jgi:hypothetical protein